MIALFNYVQNSHNFDAYFPCLNDSKKRSPGTMFSVSLDDFKIIDSRITMFFLVESLKSRLSLFMVSLLK